LEEMSATSLKPLFLLCFKKERKRDTETLRVLTNIYILLLRSLTERCPHALN